MPIFKNNFTEAIVQKDLDERLVSPKQLVDSENISCLTNEGGQKGVLKPALGNLKKTDYATLYGIVNAKTIGRGSNSSDNLIYNFVCGNNYDAVIEYNPNTNQSAIVAKATTGGALNFSKNKRITGVDIFINSTGEGNLLSFSGDDNPPRILNIKTFKELSLVTPIDGFTSDEISLIKVPPKYPISLLGKTSTENSNSNYINDKFISFGYMYKYKDGFYSAISPWSKYFFEPSQFDLDFDTFENFGMLNQKNAVDLTFNTGKSDVTAVTLVFKLSNSRTIFVIDDYNKEDEGWADNAIETIEFNNSKVYKILDESQYFRNYDNVPIKAGGQFQIGNRLAFYDYTEGRNIVDSEGNKVKQLFTTEFISKEIISKEISVANQSVTYTYESPSVTLPKGKVILSLSGIDLKKGSVVYINFDILSNEQDINFVSTFQYVLDVDYANVSALISSSGFIESLAQFNDYFQNNGGVVLPDGYIDPYTYVKGFEITASGSNMIITFPIVMYEIADPPPPNIFLYDYFSNSDTSASFRNIAVSTSMKSNRDYEVCLFYIDPQGRETTAQTSKTNTVYIPNQNSITQNIIKVSIPDYQNAPEGFERYKFGVKQSRSHYEQIFANIFFVDGDFVWIKLDGENKNKVKENDVLIVKKDGRGVLSEIKTLKVLEVKDQPKDFIVNNRDPRGVLIVEPAGLYMKVRPNDVEMKYNTDEFQRYTDVETDASADIDLRFGGLKRYNEDTASYEDIPLRQGSTVNIKINLNPIGGGTPTTLDKTWNIQNDYNSFEDFWTSVAVPSLPFYTGNSNQFTWNNFVFEDDAVGNRFFRVYPPDAGGLLVRADGALNIRSVDGYFIFETEPIDVTDDIFYKTPETYTINNGKHEMVDHYLTDTFNCICFGNGAESYQIKDGFNTKELAIDYGQLIKTTDEYKQIRRYADITYSEVYQESTNTNKLNEFNLFNQNYKDDIEKAFGKIVWARGFETNIDIIQEDKYSVIYYGKDFLYNTDGSANLQKIPEVLGQQKTLDGEYGCSHNHSVDYFGFNRYFVDTKRGVVLRKSNNGLFPISSQGMDEYFKRLFRDNTITQVIGEYDQFLSVFILNVKYNDDKYVTWLYSDESNGWLTRHTFNPEDMLRLNGNLYSFKNGEIYLHNQKGNLGDNYNTFYGVQSKSTFGINVSQEPSMRKNFKSLSYEGTKALDATLTSDLDKGYVSQNDFRKKEGVWYSYIKLSDDEINTELLSNQGIGVATVSGNDLTFAQDVNNLISIGDRIVDSNLNLIGIVLNKERRKLTLDGILGGFSGGFVLAAKYQSVENQSMNGYYLRVDCELETNEYYELFCINTEISISKP